MSASNDPNSWFNGQKPSETSTPSGQQEVYNSPTLANAAYGAQPAPQPVTGSDTKSNKLPLIIIGALLVIFALVAGVALLANGSKKEQATPAADTTQKSEILTPADSIGLAEVDNSLTQDLSSLNDEKDFPAASLDDKTLGL